jgi:GNAT superfamily N-acetyltransferase
MAPEKFVLSECTLDDLPAMITVHLDAFANDPFSSYTFPREIIGATEQHRWMTEFLTGHFAKPEMAFYKITETNTGNLAAWIRYVVPHLLSEEESERRKQERDKKMQAGTFWPRGTNLEIVAATFGTLAKLKEKYLNDAETYCKSVSFSTRRKGGLLTHDLDVQLLATAPAYQRRGLGNRLLKHVLQMADKEGKMAYIEATDAGFPIYLKLGWKQIDVVELDLSKYGGKGIASNRLMLREPQPIL